MTEPIRGGITRAGVAGDESSILALPPLILKRASLLGLQVPGGSRLHQSADYLRRTQQFDVQYDPAGGASELAAVESYRTLLEFQLILSNVTPKDGWARAKLERMFGGPHVPNLDALDPARDTQAELLAGLVMYAAGFAVSVAEPDLLLVKGKRRFGVAVKRVVSPRKFAVRVKEAQAQMEKAGVNGWIIVYTDQLINEWLFESRGESIGRKLASASSEWAEHLRNDQSHKRIVAVSGLGSSAAYHRFPPYPGWHCGLHFTPQYVVTKETPLAVIRGVGDNMSNAVARLLYPQMMKALGASGV